MNIDRPDIGIVYCKNSFEVFELADIESEMTAHGLKLMAHERSPYINASIDFFVPFLQILISPDMVLALSQGLLTNAAYDGIKALLKRIYNKFHKKPVIKIQGGNITEEAANIHFVVGNNHLVLPVDIDTEKFEYVVDKFMSVAATSAPIETTYTFFSEKDNAVLSKTENEIIREEYEKQQSNNNQET